jgi:hypothetical protein
LETTSETPGRPISHAFLADVSTGLVHLVSVETRKAECAPSWAPMPAGWIAFEGGKRMDRVCGACLAMAEALRATGQLETIGPALQPDRSDSITELDAAEIRARRAAARRKGKWRGGA